MEVTPHPWRRRVIVIGAPLILIAGSLCLGVQILIRWNPKDRGQSPFSDPRQYPVNLRTALLRQGELDHADIALCVPYGSNRFQQAAAAAWQWHTLKADETEALLAGLAESYKIHRDDGITGSFGEPRACLRFWVKERSEPAFLEVSHSGEWVASEGYCRPGARFIDAYRAYIASGDKQKGPSLQVPEENRAKVQ